MEITFTAPITPHGKQRARTVHLPNGAVSSYTPKETARFENAIACAYRIALHDARMLFAPGQPIGMEAVFHMPIPKSASRRERERLLGEWHTKKPDGSNIIKSVEDALNKLAYADDGQIADSHFIKIYSDRPRVEVRLFPLKPRVSRIGDPDYAPILEF